MERSAYFDIFQNYVIRTKKRDELTKYLDNQRIETLISWAVPNHRQKALKNLNRFELPVTEQISKEVISLPMYPELTNEQIKYVIESIVEFYE
jgi:dTDP-4-amino-4,6-dideoxygalactose transaminase